MKGRILTAAKVVLSLGLLGWLLAHAGLRTIGGVIAGADRRWLIAGIALGFVATFIQTTQWHSLLGTLGMRRSRLRCLRLVYVGYAFTAVLPSAVGGDVVRAALVAEKPSERVDGAASVVLQRVCNFPGMMTLLAVGFVLTVNEADASRVRLAGILGFGCGFAILVVAMSPLLGWISRRRLLQRHGLARATAKLFSQLDAFRGRRRELLAASGRGTTFWSISVLSQWCFMHAVGIPAGIGLAAIVVTTVNLMTLLPISINGYGVREGGYTAFLAVGSLASPAQALATSFCVAAQTLLWGLVGIFAWLTMPGRPSRAASPAPAPAMNLVGVDRSSAEPISAAVV